MLPTELTGYAALTTYSQYYSIDGGANQTVSFLGSAATTFQDLIDILNAQLVGATAAIQGDNIVITSATTGATSSVIDNGVGPSGDAVWQGSTLPAASPSGVVYISNFSSFGVDAIPNQINGANITIAGGLGNSIGNGGSTSIYGGTGGTSNGDGGDVIIQSGGVVGGGQGGDITIQVPNSSAYIQVPATPGYLFVSISPFVTAADPTGLIAATLYDVSLDFDPTSFNPQTITVTIDGTDAPTYQDLIDQINLQIGQSYFDAVFDAPVAAGTATNLAAGLYDFQYAVDNGSFVVATITSTGPAMTFGQLATAMTSVMVGAEAFVDTISGNLRMRSTGNSIPITIYVFDGGGPNTPLFSSISTTPIFQFLDGPYTAYGLASLVGLPFFGQLQITSNSCGAGCFGSTSNVIDNGADVQIYLFGALSGFSSTSSNPGIDDQLSEEDGGDVFIAAGNSGGTGDGGYGGTSAGSVTIQGGSASGDENGGTIRIEAGDGGSNGAYAGAVNITAGEAGSGGDGGEIRITAGDTNAFADITGNAGSVSITAGGGSAGDSPGGITIEAGTAPGTPGYVDNFFLSSPTPINFSTPSGLVDGPIYSVTVTLDGGAPTTANLGPTAGTDYPVLGLVVSELGNQGINAQLLTNKIRISSFTTGLTSTVVQSADTLFPALTQFNFTDTPTPGTSDLGGNIDIQTMQTGRVYLQAGVVCEIPGHGWADGQIIQSDYNSFSSSNPTAALWIANTSTDSGGGPVDFPVHWINLGELVTRTSFPIEQQAVTSFKLMVSAGSFSPSMEFASFHIQGAIYKGTTNASTVLIGPIGPISPTFSTGGNAAGWTVTLTADTTVDVTGGGLTVTVETPIASTSIKWAAKLDMVRA